MRIRNFCNVLIDPINLGLTTLLVQLSTISVLEASTFCQMRMQESPAAGAAFMEQSMWSTFLNSSVFSPVPARDALRSLLTQTNELAGVMNSFKERYVSEITIFMALWDC